MVMILEGIGLSDVVTWLLFAQMTIPPVGGEALTNLTQRERN